MIFKLNDINKTVGEILANTYLLNYNGKKCKLLKGSLIDCKTIKIFKQNNIAKIYTVSLESDDINENEASELLCKDFINISENNNLKVKNLKTGRSNILALSDGFFEYNRNQLIKINNISNLVAISAIMPGKNVKKGQELVTTKIIPFALNFKVLDRIRKVGSNCFKLHPYRKANIDVIQTYNSNTKESILNKTFNVTKKRIENCGFFTINNHVVLYDKQHVKDSLSKCLQANTDLILIFGVNATSDYGDLIPTAIKEINGVNLRLGMPVEPGNLILISSILNKNKKVYIIIMPGCARSPKENGIDWILWRILADQELNDKVINEMSVGGLIK